MATVVPCASCYAHSSVQPLHLFGKGPRGDNFLALLTYRGPRCTPRPHLTCHAPKMTLRQICCKLKVMKKVRNRDAAAAAAAAARKQGSAAPAPVSPGTKSEKKCVPSCVRHKRSIKRAG
eukprot:superscaffoldBa00001688_g11629